MKKRLTRPLGVLIAGLVSVTLAGTGLVAQVSDTVEVRNNQVASEAYEAPGPIVALEVGTFADGGDCTNAIFEPDGIVDTTVEGTIDLATYIETGADYQIIPLSRFCLTNTGSEDGEVLATLLSRVSTEAADCNTTELAAEQALVDAGAAAAVTCATGEPGELDQAGSITAFPVFGQDCYQQQALFGPADGVGSSKLMGTNTALVLSPGEVCEVEMRFILTNEVPAAVPAATSDLLSFDMAFTLVPQA